MKGQIETRLGTIVIGNEVIATCAGSVAVECFGIVFHTEPQRRIQRKDAARQHKLCHKPPRPHSPCRQKRSRQINHA